MRLALLALLLLPGVVHAEPISLILGSIAAFAAANAGAITVASIALTIGTTVFGAVAQRAAAKKAKRKAAQAREDFLNSLQERTVTRIATYAPHRYVYGRDKVGSDIVAVLVSGMNEEYKHLVCIHAAHECEAIEEVYIEGKALGALDADGFVTGGEYYSARTESVTETFSAAPFTLSRTPSSAFKVVAYGTWISGAFRFPSSGEVSYTRSGNTITVTGAPTSPFPFGGTMQITHYSVSYQYTVNTSQVRVRKHLGAPGDAADASLLAECSDKWKPTATLTGFCYTVIRLDLRQAAFQGGLPSVEVLIKGKKLYDPRTGLTQWSENPDLVIYDYLTSEMCGVPATDLPLSHYITAANVCDEVQSFGALYTCNGAVSADEDQAKILEAMADSMAGGIVAMTWEVYAGKYTAPIAALDQSDIVGTLAVSPGISDSDIINSVRGQFVSAENAYVPTDFSSYQNAVYLAADGKEKWGDITYPFTNTTQRVHNLARIEVEDQRNAFTFKAEFSLKAWDLGVGDRVTLTSAFLGQIDKTYRITDKSYAPGTAITLTLKEDAASIWDLADTVILDDTPNTNLPNPFAVQKLDIVKCYSGTDALLAQGDGTIISRILVTWSGAVLADGLVEIEWCRDSETVWRKTTVTADQASAYLSPVVDGGWYIVRARPINPYFNVRSDWTYADLHQVVGKTEPPSDITDLAIDGKTLSWTMPTDIDLDGAVFRYHFGNNLDWGTAIPLHSGVITSSPYTPETLPYGSITIMGKAIDTSGNESVNVGTIFTNLGDAPVANVVETYSFHPVFDGTLTDCTVSGGQVVADEVESFYGDDDQSFYGADDESFYKPDSGYRKMVYESGPMLVSSALAGSKMTLSLETNGIDVMVEYCVSGLGSFYGPDDEPFYGSDTESFFSPKPDVFDAIDLANFDPSNPNSFLAVDLANFDPSNPNSFLAVDLSAFSEDGAFYGSSSGAWRAWPGQVVAQNADYQFRVTIGSGATQGRIINMTVTIDAPDMIETISDLAISSSGTVVPYTKNFTSIKAVQATLQANSSGARTVDINKTNPLHPTVKVYNSSGMAIGGAKVDITLQGY